jgi:hypothetical protein
MRATFRLLLLPAAALAALAACADPLRVKATSEVFTDTLTLYALNRSPSYFPSALNTFAGAALAPTSPASFDVAFDIDDQRRAVIYPNKLVVGTLYSTHRVGAQVVDAPFESITSAPRRNYNYDTPTVVAQKAVVALAADNPVCATSLSSTIYSKLVVDTVALDAPEPFVRVRITADPNCGFRSFLPGIPKD